MDPQGGPAANPHHQRALDLLLSNMSQDQAQAGNHDAFREQEGNMTLTISSELDDSEENGPRSAWSPDRGDLEAYAVWKGHYDSGFSKRGQGSRRMFIGNFWGSLRAIVLSSWLNIFLLALPTVWTLHLLDKISHWLTFTLCFVSLIPLSKLLDFGGENLALYCGKEFGDLIIVTLNNAIEATLATFLLIKWELRLLQSTVIGVVLLRLLLVPGISFIIGGSRVAAQELHPHLTELNRSLLTVGVLTLLLPVSFFAALDHGIIVVEGEVNNDGDADLINDTLRGHLLRISRGLSIVLIVIYLFSRYFLYNPPGEDKALHKHKDAPSQLKEMVRQMKEKEPEVNLLLSILLLLIAVGLMGVTTEFLVESIDPMREGGIPEEWFGLIVLPFISIFADLLISITFLLRKTCFSSNNPNSDPNSPDILAESQSIESAIQFLLLWSPFLVLLGWILSRPMSLLFDSFEVTILIGSSLLLSYVIADSRTNWMEGVVLVGLYVMIATTAWFYPQQPEVRAMLARADVHGALLSNPEFGPAMHVSASVSTTTSISTIITTSTVTSAGSTGTSTTPPPSTSTSTSSPSSTATTNPNSNANANATLSENLQSLIQLYNVLLSNANELGQLLDSVNAGVDSGGNGGQGQGQQGDQATGKVVNGLHLNLNGTTPPPTGKKDQEEGVRAAREVVEKGLDALESLKRDARFSGANNHGG
ncbi:hypothetical protein D9758_001349 [Tetrapyrgos nigripes]|uniref:Sodium/calcium exchanger membrane region domain-containing protein n=1 Tax=Tetrapyrgos nigripes TaxID=182062 RepID=A0A8H5GS35_9AGAR|nr:hypothetical protein D9758_001349 [Tetrapyrgos nigripes]